MSVFHCVPYRAALDVFTAHWENIVLSCQFYPLFLDAGQWCQGVTFKRLISLCGIWVNKGGITFHLCNAYIVMQYTCNCTILCCVKLK